MQGLKSVKKYYLFSLFTGYILQLLFVHRNSLDQADLGGGIGQGVMLVGDGSLQHSQVQLILL